MSGAVSCFVCLKSLMPSGVKEVSVDALSEQAIAFYTFVAMYFLLRFVMSKLCSQVLAYVEPLLAFMFVFVIWMVASIVGVPAEMVLMYQSVLKV